MSAPTACRRLAIGALLGARLPAARSEPTRFYLLSANQRARRLSSRQGPIVFVDQATVAPYLDRAQIVTRVTPDQVAFADVRTWVRAAAPHDHPLRGRCA